MGLYEDLIRERDEAAQTFVDMDFSDKKKPLRRSCAEASEATKPDPDAEWWLPYGQLKDAIKKLACPVCDAASEYECEPVARNTQNIAGAAVHQGRARAFGVTRGVWLEDLKRMPYLRYPYADLYLRWGVFRLGAGGQPYKKNACCFRTYEEAHQVANDMSKVRETYTVCPMTQPGGTGAWVRNDLAPWDERPENRL